MSSADILFERRGAAGLVTLNRPQALNAVTHGMVRALRAQLDAWARRSGGHARRHHRRPASAPSRPAATSARSTISAKPAAPTRRLQFWRDEYPLNAVIKHYRKPYVALIDGIVMGGGVGVSVHGSHRVAGDRFSFAMPEVGIGFFPDVGATWFLPRMPGELGAYCALTGERFNSADARRRRHRDASRAVGALSRRCSRASPARVSVDAVLAAFAEPARARGRSRRAARPSTGCSRASASRTFSRRSSAKRFGSADAAWARQTAATIRTKSPLSLKLALAQVRRGKALRFRGVHAHRIPHSVARHRWP